MDTIIQFIQTVGPSGVLNAVLFVAVFFYRLKWRQLSELVEELEKECGELRSGKREDE
jgi:Na+/melibiose symporter-like transporter